MSVMQVAYGAFTIALTVLGLFIVAKAVRAYMNTSRSDMMYLSMGFALIVGAAVGTSVFAYISEFKDPPTILSVNYMVTTLGFLFVMYSLRTEE